MIVMKGVYGHEHLESCFLVDNYDCHEASLVGILPQNIYSWLPICFGGEKG